jgi:hypothetical protein
MSRARTLFKYVVWFGILGNWTFAVFALFVNPYQLVNTLGLGPVSNSIWLVNYSVLLAILSCFYIPAAHDPFRYRANAWLLIVGRLVPASSFFLGVFFGFMPRGFLNLGIGDGLIGIIELILLVKLLQQAGPGSLAEREREERVAEAAAV